LIGQVVFGVSETKLIVGRLDSGFLVRENCAKRTLSVDAIPAKVHQIGRFRRRSTTQPAFFKLLVASLFGCTLGVGSRMVQIGLYT